MYEPQITVVGHLAYPPRMRVLAGGTVVTDFRVAQTPRKQDKESGVWSDQETLWFGVTCWRNLAENVALSLGKGDRVVVTGRLQARSWVTKEGEERKGFDIDAQSVGFDLSRGPVRQFRVERATTVEQPEGVERTATSADDQWGGSALQVDPATGEVTGQQAEPAAA
jgi:single-strand DNA-binding protein